MILHEFINPVPAVSPLGDCYIWYVVTGGMLENDCYCCIMKEDGAIRHLMGDQLNVWHNETYGISKKKS